LDNIITPNLAAESPFHEEESAYGRMRYKIQARQSHGTLDYRVDNAAVFEMLNTVISAHGNVKTWIKSGPVIVVTPATN
jgi:hypothetical protein